MLGITDYLWRLLPGNPILLRVVETAGKRWRDLIVRCTYLGLLVGLVTFFMLQAQGSGLDSLAKTSAKIFQNMSFLQLAAVALLAPVFTAGAITQEKDSQTYDILLATPLTNGQIILGSLGSRLFFVLTLLISGIPVFSITQIFGGVAISSIAMSFLIAAATAVVTGCLAMAIATFKVGTRRTIFSFYLFIVIYIVGGILLDQVPAFQIPGATVNPSVASHISWFTGSNPFLAQRVILHYDDYAPPNILDLPPALQVWPIGWYLSNPAGFYVVTMFVLSAVLLVPSVVFLRVLAQSSQTIRGWVSQKLHISSGSRNRKPRSVWSNPIAWREARTKASAAKASIVRYSFIGAGLIGAIALLYLFMSEQPYTTYITHGSYDEGSRTLAIREGEAVQSYTLSNATVVTLNGQEVPQSRLYGKYEVVGAPIVDPRQRRLISAISIQDIPRRLRAREARQYLLGAIFIEFTVILLIVTNAAASTVTREKEDGTLDLLLTTPITSRYYIWGKLRGLVSYCLPLIAVPIVSMGIFVAYDLVRMLSAGDSFQWIVFPESVLVMPAMLVIIVAFAAILGMNMSLRFRTTVRAVMASVGIVVGICAALGFCGYHVLDRGGSTVALAFASFSPFTILSLMIDPYTFAGAVFNASSTEVSEGRVSILIAGWASAAAYAMIVWSMYKAMVKNFDMTIRRQSR